MNESAPSLDSTETQRFLVVANEYCALIEQAGAFSRAELLRQLDRILPTVYHAGATLPDVEPATSEGSAAGRDIGPDDVRHVLETLTARLKPYGEYLEIFDPVDPADTAPVTGFLGLDLSEVYLDLQNAVRLSRDGSTHANDVLWEWRFGFTSHWGRHVASATRVVNALLHSQHVDVLEDGAPDV